MKEWQVWTKWQALYPFTLVLSFVLVFPGQTQIPADYWDAADITNATTLRASLNDIITAGHTVVNYNNSAASYDALARTDAALSDATLVRLLYSGDLRPITPNDKMADSNPATGGWNREHVFPQSFFNSANPMLSDLHALFPVDADINIRRSNSPYDNVDNPTLIDVFGNRSTTSVFEPRDSMKGDAARAVFYMDVRYEGHSEEPDLTIINTMPRGTGFGEMAFLNTLLQWHIDDPVDTFELVRNDRVYSEQGNANPFISHPEWASLVYSATEPPPPATNVHIVMVSTRGSDGAATKECLVLANPNEVPVDLTHWELRSRAGASTSTYTTALSGTILPFSHFIIASEAYPDINDIEGAAGDLRVTSIVGGMGDTTPRSIALFDETGTKQDGFSWSGGANDPLNFNDGTPFAGATTNAQTQVYARKRPGGTSGLYTDTENNSSDLEVRTLGVPKTPPSDHAVRSISVWNWAIH